MHFDSFSDFIAMGDYGSYVWSSTFIVLFSVLVLVIFNVTDRKRIFQRINKELDRAAKIKKAKQTAYQKSQEIENNEP